MPAETYKTKLGCDNCGNIAFYTLPVRTRIEEFDVDEEGSHSSYSRPNGADPTFLICLFCKLACLKVFWWDESEVPVKSEAKS
jgi:hypothetical protein